MKLVMFDIDGTLTDTCVRDENEFVRAVQEVLDVPEINTDWASFVYVGDGSWDVHAARELDWGFVGIASGTRALQLRALGARHVFPDYLESEAILSVLDAASLSA
jgi:phosphoglycolate phosphatase-like HAD superfamily hydrolase